MNYLRNVAVLGLVVLLTFSGTTLASAQVSNAFVPSTLYDEAELMPYPTLAGPVFLHTVGPSGEFSASQEIKSATSGVAILNWTHTPGVDLQYNTSSYYPICLEYAYIAENFSWDRNVQPTALNTSIYLQIKESGSFRTDGWSDMFDIQIWILGNEIGKREIGIINSVQGYQHYSQTVYPVSFQDAFDSLATDPNSHLQLAVALVPAADFMEDQGTQPWMNYTGSVQITAMEIHLNALYRTNPELPHIRSSSINNTWRVGSSENFLDSCMGGSEDLYILSYQRFTDAISGNTLTQVNSEGQIVWRKSLNTTASGWWTRVVATSEDVYLLGSGYLNDTFTPVLVDVFSRNGTRVNVFGLNAVSTGSLGGVDISPDGNLYIGTYSSMGSGRVESLLKVSPDGSILWKRDFGDDSHRFMSSVQADDSGNVFTDSEGQVIKWSSQGTQLWEIDSSFSPYYTDRSLYVLKDGSSIVITSTLQGTNITELDPEGIQAWSFTEQMRYAPHWRELFYVPWVTESPSGLLYFLYTTYGIHQSSIVVVMNRDGQQAENFTVSFGQKPYTSANVPDYRQMYVTNEDVMYLVGRVVNQDYDYSLTFAIYESELSNSGVPETGLLSASVAAGAVVGVLVYLEQRRKRIAAE